MSNGNFIFVQISMKHLFNIEKHAVCQSDYRIQSFFLSIWHVHGDLCMHLGIDTSTGLFFFFNFRLVSDRILIWGTFLSLYLCTSHPLTSSIGKL